MVLTEIGTLYARPTSTPMPVLERAFPRGNSPMQDFKVVTSINPLTGKPAPPPPASQHGRPGHPGHGRYIDKSLLYAPPVCGWGIRSPAARASRGKRKRDPWHLLTRETGVA